MIIAVASGKGGTGKTTVSTNLALALSSTHRVQYLDCDVEEPNGHIFLKPQIESTAVVTTPVPVIDESKCTVCGKCKDICRYNAIVLLGKSVLTFPELCHGCGGCSLVCPTGALIETQREIGFIEQGRAGDIMFVNGMLNIGEVLSPLVIKYVKERIDDDSIAIIDVPPGTSCPVVEAVKGTDYVVLVTEPTPFGVNDLKLAVDMLKALNLPFGVVVNRADAGDEAVFDYCRGESIEILMKIPDDRRIAQAYSRGEMAVCAVPECRAQFTDLAAAIKGKFDEYCGN
ncbi:ATP-binding protein [bacterium]|nr:ATP-binding protein [bacterium]